MIEDIRNRLAEVLFRKGQPVLDFDLVEVGAEWAAFGAAEGDEAKMISNTPIAYCIHYRCDRSGVFPIHRHSSSETILILSGSMQVRTPHDSYDLGAGDSCKIQAGVAHKATWSGGMHAIVTWAPGFGDKWITSPLEELS